MAISPTGPAYLILISLACSFIFCASSVRLHHVAFIPWNFLDATSKGLDFNSSVLSIMTRILRSKANNAATSPKPDTPRSPSPQPGDKRSGTTEERKDSPKRPRATDTPIYNEFEDDEQTSPVKIPTPTVTHAFVNNEFILSASKTWTSVLDPVTQGLLTRVPDCTLDEIQLAVSAASEAQGKWAAMSFAKRREYLLKLVDVIREMTPEILACLSREVGKTLADADAEVYRGIDSIQAACSIGPEMAGMYLGADPTQLTTLHEPLGACMAVTPFTFPFMIPLWSIPFALITGNTFILKPSEKAPTASTLLATAFFRAGFPPGVFNIVHGGPSAVDKLLSQPSIQTVSFVGSETAAERIYDHARATRKRIQAECGGKNHGVVLDDADMMSTLYAIAGSAFGAAGQRCMAMSVAVFVGSTREWIPKLVELAGSMVVGCPSEQHVKIGPLISVAAKDKVCGMIQRAVEERASLLLDGRDVEVSEYPTGNFVGPTILADVKTYMECYQTEILGPVLICMEVDTLEEAIDLVNQSRFGNGCSLFTSSGQRATIFQRSVNVGQIGINVPLLAPYGLAVRTSNKDSFLGDMNFPGRTYWPFFTQTKTVSFRWDR